MGTDKSAYTIQGVLKDKKTGQGVPGYMIKAFDIDHLTDDDLLGDAKTDDQGRFVIRYRKTDFVKRFLDLLEDSLFKKGPDIVLTVESPEGKPVTTTKPRSEGKRFEFYEIPIGIESEIPEPPAGKIPIDSVVKDSREQETLKRMGVLRVENLRTTDPDKVIKLVPESTLTKERLIELKTLAFLAAATPNLFVAETLSKAGVKGLEDLRRLSMDQIDQMLTAAIAAGQLSEKEKPSKEDMISAKSNAKDLSSLVLDAAIFDLKERGRRRCEPASEDCCGSNRSVLSKGAYLAYLVRKTGEDGDELSNRLHQNFLDPSCDSISIVRFTAGILEKAMLAGDFGLVAKSLALRSMLAYRLVVANRLIRHKDRLSASGRQKIEDIDDPLSDINIVTVDQFMAAIEKIDQYNTEVAGILADDAVLGSDIIESAWLQCTMANLNEVKDKVPELSNDLTALVHENDEAGLENPFIEVGKNHRIRLIDLTEKTPSELGKRYYVNFLSQEGNTDECEQAIITLQRLMRCDRAWYLACCPANTVNRQEKHDQFRTRFRSYEQYRLWIEQRLFPENFYEHQAKRQLIRGNVEELTKRLSAAKDALKQVTEKDDTDETMNSVMGLFEEGFQVIDNLIQINSLVDQGQVALRDEEYGVALACYKDAQAQIRRHVKQYHATELATPEQIFLGTSSSCAGFSDLVADAETLTNRLNTGYLQPVFTRSLIPGLASRKMSVEGWFPEMDRFPGHEELENTFNTLSEILWNPTEGLPALFEQRSQTLLNRLFLRAKRQREIRGSAPASGWEIFDYPDGVRRSFPFIIREDADLNKTAREIQAATINLLHDLFGDQLINAINEAIRNYSEDLGNAVSEAQACIEETFPDHFPTNVFEAGTMLLNFLFRIPDLVHCFEDYIEDTIEATARMTNIVVEAFNGDDHCPWNEDFFDCLLQRITNAFLPLFTDLANIESITDLPDILLARAEETISQFVRRIDERLQEIDNRITVAEQFFSAVVKALFNIIFIDDESTWGMRPVDGIDTIQELSNYYNVDDVRHPGSELRRGTLLVDQHGLENQESYKSFSAQFTLRTSDNDDLGVIFSASGVSDQGGPNYYLLSLRNNQGEDTVRNIARLGFLVGYPIAILGLAAATHQVGTTAAAFGFGNFFPVFGHLFGGVAGFTLATNISGAILIGGALAFPAAAAAYGFAEQSLFPTDSAGAFIRLLKVRGNEVIEKWPKEDDPKPNQDIRIEGDPKPNQDYRIEVAISSSGDSRDINVRVFECAEQINQVANFSINDDEPLSPGAVGLYSFANSPSIFKSAEISYRPSGVEASLGDLLFLPDETHQMDWFGYLARRTGYPEDLQEWVKVDADSFQLVKVVDDSLDEALNLSLFDIEETKVLQYEPLARRADRNELASLVNQLVALLPHYYFFQLPLSIGDALHGMGDYEGAKQNYDICYDVFANEIERLQARGGPIFADPDPGPRYRYLHTDYPRLGFIGVEQRMLIARHAANELAMGEAAFIENTPESRQRAYESFMRVLRIYGLKSCCNDWLGQVLCVPGAAPSLAQEPPTGSPSESVGGIYVPGVIHPDVPGRFHKCESEYIDLKEIAETLLDTVDKKELEGILKGLGISSINDIEDCNGLRELLETAKQLMADHQVESVATKKGSEHLVPLEWRYANAVNTYETVIQPSKNANGSMPSITVKPGSGDSMVYLPTGIFGGFGAFQLRTDWVLSPTPYPAPEPDTVEQDACGENDDLAILHDLLDRKSFGFWSPTNPVEAFHTGRACLYLWNLDLDLNILGLRDDQATTYTYPYLISLARHFANFALSAEKDFIQFREKLSTGRTTMMQWQHSLATLGAQARIHQIAVEQADYQIKSAEYQIRMDNRMDAHLGELIGWNDIQMLCTGLYGIASITFGLLTSAAGVGVAAFTGGAMGVPQIIGGVSGIPDTLVGGAQSIAGLYGQRLELEQKRALLRDFELPMAYLAKQYAQAAKRTAEIQGEINQLEIGYAHRIMTYISNQLLSPEMYSHLARQSKRNYRQFLAYATRAALMAERALELQQGRQFSIIKLDYFDVAMQGLLSGESLITDIETLEYQRFLSDDRRQYPPVKVFSLPNLFPLEFEYFKTTGQFWFRTNQDDFDRDFPGHYYRLIRSVRVLVHTLAGSEGIKASLSNLGPTEVVAKEDGNFRTHFLPGISQTYALSLRQDGKWLEPLNPEGDEKRVPFAGLGVAGTWLFEIPKWANRIHYDNIADIQIQIEYSSFQDDGYKNKLLEKMQNRIFFGSRRYSFLRNLPDQWYHLKNPNVAGHGYTNSHQLNLATTSITANAIDYPPNEKNRELEGISIAFFNRTDETAKVEKIYLASRRQIEALWKRGVLTLVDDPEDPELGSRKRLIRDGELMRLTEDQIIAGENVLEGIWIRVLKGNRLVWVRKNADEQPVNPDNTPLPEVIPPELLKKARVPVAAENVRNPISKTDQSIFNLRFKENGKTLLLRGNEITRVEDHSIVEDDVRFAADDRWYVCVEPSENPEIADDRLVPGFKALNFGALGDIIFVANYSYQPFNGATDE